MHNIAAVLGFFALAFIPSAAAHAATGNGMLASVAKELGCSPKEVLATYLPGNDERFGSYTLSSWEFSGCGLTVVSHGSGGSWRFDDLAVRRRAPIELQCDAAEVKFNVIDSKTRIAQGCGKQMTYVYTGVLVPTVVAGTWAAN